MIAGHGSDLRSLHPGDVAHPQKSDLFLGGNPQALAFGAAIRRRQKPAAAGQKLGHRIRIKMIVMGVGDHQQVGLPVRPRR